MNTKLAALALAAVIATGVIAYYSLNPFTNSKEPKSTPLPTEPPIPSMPTDQNSTVNAWGQFNTTYRTELIIISPENQTDQPCSLTLQVNVTTSFWMINSVYYKADWLDGYIRLYNFVKQSQSTSQQYQAITITADFIGVPAGIHTIEVIANYHDDSHSYGIVNFNVKN